MSMACVAVLLGAVALVVEAVLKRQPYFAVGAALVALGLSCFH